MRLALIAAAAVALSLGSTASSPASDGWAALHRPLQLKTLKAGARCPVTPTHALDNGRLSGVGNGPAYPMPSPFSSDGRHPGWIASKTLWAWPARYLKHAAHVLVRGRRLDRAGSMRFQLGPDWGSPLRSELHIDTSQPVGSFSQTTWGSTVTMLFGRKPGCYGLQLDTSSGTSIVVVRA
jgi:hypothetical protein